MEELIPNITINSKYNAKEFISQLHTAVKFNKSLFNVTYEKNQFKDGRDFLILFPKVKNGNKNLHVLGYNFMDLHQKVHVELLAEEWKVEPITYDLYSSEAKRVILPLLKDYNRKHNTRLRLCIQSKENLKIKLPEIAGQFFKGFITSLYYKKLHPNNWNRFYWFIWHCHARRVKLQHYELQRLLVENKVDYETASELSEIYRIIREYLQTIKGIPVNQ